LAVGPAESTQLISFYIDYYATYSLSPNTFIVELFAKGIRNLLAIPKKFARNSADAFVNVARTLMAIKVHIYNFLPPDAIVEVSMLEALLANYGDKRHDELEFLSEHGMVTHDMYRLLNVMYYHVYRMHDKKSVLDIMNYIFQSKTLALDDIVDSIEETRGSIKFGKNDIIWYMWKLLQLLVHSGRLGQLSQLDMNLVNTNLYIFTTHFQKKNRIVRTGIIAYLFVLFSSKNLDKRLINTAIKVSHTGTEPMPAVCGESNTQEVVTKRKHVIASDHPNPNPKHASLSLPPKENMDYLKCFTVANREMIDAIRVERESASSQAKQQVGVKMV
jgi:hypothetical protein